MVGSNKMPLDFLISLIKLSSLKDLDYNMFETLLASQEMLESIDQRRKNQEKIFECMLNQYQFQTESKVWLNYIQFLAQFDHKKARI